MRDELAGKTCPSVGSGWRPTNHVAAVELELDTPRDGTTQPRDSCRIAQHDKLLVMLQPEPAGPGCVGLQLDIDGRKTDERRDGHRPTR